jgi:hypothetical protein
MAQKWATTATFAMWPFSRLHSQLPPGYAFRVELTEFMLSIPYEFYNWAWLTEFGWTSELKVSF